MWSFNPLSWEFETTVLNPVYDPITHFVNDNPHTSIAIVMITCMVCVELFLFAAETIPDVAKNEAAISWKVFDMCDSQRARYIKQRMDRLDYASARFAILVAFLTSVTGLRFLILRNSELEPDKAMWKFNVDQFEKLVFELKKIMRTRFWSIGAVMLASLVFDNRLHLFLQTNLYILVRNWFVPKEFESYWLTNKIWVARLWTLVSLVKYMILWFLVYPAVCKHEKARSGFILVFFLFGCDFMTIICPLNIINGCGRWSSKLGLGLFKYVKSSFGV